MNYLYEKERIVAKDEKGQKLAEITFPFRGADLVEIDHVFVSEECRGQGIAARLVELAYAHLKENQKKVEVTCPYAVAWFARHPDKQDIVVNLPDFDN